MKHPDWFLGCLLGDLSLLFPYSVLAVFWVWVWCWQLSAALDRQDNTSVSPRYLTNYCPTCRTAVGRDACSRRYEGHRLFTKIIKSSNLTHFAEET